MRVMKLFIGRMSEAGSCGGGQLFSLDIMLAHGGALTESGWNVTYMDAMRGGLYGTEHLWRRAWQDSALAVAILPD